MILLPCRSSAEEVRHALVCRYVQVCLILSENFPSVDAPTNVRRSSWVCSGVIHSMNLRLMSIFSAIKNRPVEDSEESAGSGADDNDADQLWDDV